MSVLSVYMCAMCKGVGSPGAGIKDGCELPCGSSRRAERVVRCHVESVTPNGHLMKQGHLSAIAPGTQSCYRELRARNGGKGLRLD